MWWVYIIQSVDRGQHYIGCTKDLAKRLKEHNRGYNLSTAKGAPWKVVYFEKFDNQMEAYTREKKIKSYKGGNAFKKLLKP